MHEIFSTPDLADFPQSMHLAMITDAVKMQAYMQAISNTVKPGDVVLDVGSGTGILSVFAARAGASKVFAVETSRLAQYSKDVVADNALADTIEVIHEDIFSPNIPPIQADVVISELLGSFGIGENVVRILNHVRENHMKPGALMVPENIDLYLAPIQCLLDYRRVSHWKRRICNIDFSAIQELAYNSVYHLPENSAVLLADPVAIKSFELNDVGSPTFTTDTEFRVTRDGVLHGVAGWFSSRLCEGVYVDNAPYSAATHWGQIMFPTGEAVMVHPDDTLHFGFSETEEPPLNIWEWSGSIVDAATLEHSKPFCYRSERKRKQK